MRMTSMRLEDMTVTRLNRVASALAAQHPGVTVSRNDALRVTVERGLKVVEEELGLSSEVVAGQSDK